MQFWLIPWLPSVLQYFGWPLGELPRSSSSWRPKNSTENRLPLSSTYKKIRKLCSLKLLCIDRIQLDDNGKKVLFYKSKIRSCQFYLRQEGAVLQFEGNEAARIIEGIRAR